MKLISLILGGALALTCATSAWAAPTLQHQPVLVQFSHQKVGHEPNPLASAAALTREHATNDPNWYLVSQNRPNNWDARLASSWGQVVPARQGHRAYDHLVVGGTLPTGYQDRTLRGEVIAQMIIQRWEAAVKAGFPPVMIAIDEVARGTETEVAEAVTILEAYPEIVRRLAFYVVAGNSVEPKSFDQRLQDFWLRHQSLIFGEVYGGKANKGRTKTRIMLRGDAIRKMRKLGWNAYPMLSAAPRNIGTGPKAIEELTFRFKTLYRSTGMIPSLWHLGKIGTPAPYGMGARYAYLVKKARYGTTPLNSGIVKAFNFKRVKE